MARLSLLAALVYGLKAGSETLPPLNSAKKLNMVERQEEFQAARQRCKTKTVSKKDKNKHGNDNSNSKVDVNGGDAAAATAAAGTGGLDTTGSSSSSIDSAPDCDAGEADQDFQEELHLPLERKFATTIAGSAFPAYRLANVMIRINLLVASWPFLIFQGQNISTLLLPGAWSTLTGLPYLLLSGLFVLKAYRFHLWILQQKTARSVDGNQVPNL